MLNKGNSYSFICRIDIAAFFFLRKRSFENNWEMIILHTGLVIYTKSNPNRDFMRALDPGILYNRDDFMK